MVEIQVVEEHEGTSSGLRPPSPRKGVEKGLHRHLPQLLIFRGGPNPVPSPALLLEKVPGGRMRSLSLHQHCLQ
jgi:hypothetical protein